jgi:hypothetical protein
MQPALGPPQVSGDGGRSPSPSSPLAFPLRVPLMMVTMIVRPHPSFFSTGIGEQGDRLA